MSRESWILNNWNQRFNLKLDCMYASKHLPSSSSIALLQRVRMFQGWKMVNQTLVPNYNLFYLSQKWKTIPSHLEIANV